MPPKLRLTPGWQRFERVDLQEHHGLQWLVGIGAVKSYDPMNEHERLRSTKRVNARRSALYLQFVEAKSAAQKAEFATAFGLLGLPYLYLEGLEAVSSEIIYRSGRSETLEDYWRRWHPCGEELPAAAPWEGFWDQAHFRSESVEMWEQKRRELDTCIRARIGKDGVPSRDDAAKTSNLHIDTMMAGLRARFSPSRGFHWASATLLETLYLLLATDLKSPGDRVTAESRRALSKCLWCEEPFYKLPRPDFKFCSDACRTSYHNRKQRPTRVARQKAKRWKKYGKPIEEIVRVVSEQYGRDPSEVRRWAKK